MANSQVDDLSISIHHHNPSRGNRRSGERLPSGERKGGRAYLVRYRYARYFLAERWDWIEYSAQQAEWKCDA